MRLRPLARIGWRPLQVRLFVTEIHELLKVLREKDMLDCLQLVHCHPGSQLQDIRRVKEAINELAHVYAELGAARAPGSSTSTWAAARRGLRRQRHQLLSSMNYNLVEYANDVV